MKKMISVSLLMCIMGLFSGQIWASGFIKTEQQVRVVSEFFEATMMDRLQQQAQWNSCTSFRRVWQESFFEGNADLEASFAFYARASAEDVRKYKAAFDLVYSIASRYRHNNCAAIPKAFEIIARGDLSAGQAVARH